VQSNIRASSQLEPAGCLGDLGWYTIRIILWAMKYELPIEVRGRILNGVQRPDSAQPVPLEFQGELHFASGVSATFYNSFRTNHQQWAHISGTRGYLTLSDFVLPFYGNEVSFEVGRHRFMADGCLFNMEKSLQQHQRFEYSNNHPTAQETSLFRTFADLVLSGRRDAFWPDVALKTQRVLDAALKSAAADSAAVAP
jgi:predicted dehydrogenase